MMSDIEQRLREAHPISQQYANGSKILLEAADEIAALRAREAEPVGFLTKTDLERLRRGHPAKIYAPENKVVTMHPTTQVFAHPPAANVPEMDDEVRWILGRPNFACVPMANYLRSQGYEIQRKAEDEQAAVIHWLLNMYAEHGSDWRQKVSGLLSQRTPPQADEIKGGQEAMSTFQCEECGGDTRCTDSRPIKALDGYGTRRAYACGSCGARTSTIAFSIGRDGSIADRVKAKSMNSADLSKFTFGEMACINAVLDEIAGSFVAPTHLVRREDKKGVKP